MKAGDRVEIDRAGSEDGPRFVRGWIVEVAPFAFAKKALVHFDLDRGQGPRRWVHVDRIRVLDAVTRLAEISDLKF